MSVTLRDAQPSDAEAIAAIYAYYVLNTAISFELVAPDAAEIEARMIKTRQTGFPYLVAMDDSGAVLGYAYAGAFHSRPAYRFTLENSVYVAPHGQRRGVGTLLMRKLIADCAALGYRQMLALISATDADASIAMHKRLGFREVAHLKAVGLKFGRWIDVIDMQLELGDGANSLPQGEPGKA